jgi:polyphosphate kinase 2 (PPK2 family)
VILQGTDTSGKDGTIRGVFSRMSPLGVHAVGWKAPNEEERAHDYLWRIHQQVPVAGEITVFNRSHYEDVLVPVVNGWITPSSTTSAWPHQRLRAHAQRDRHHRAQVHAAHQR